MENHVLLSAKFSKDSQITRNPYYYFAISCQNAVFDILVDEDIVTKEPKIGGILNGTFWLSGKLK